MKVTLLGTGAAYGTPTVCGFWGKCDKKNPKNRRLCQSILVESQETKLVFDIGPSFREQSNRYEISNFDAIFITHAHYDHYFGLPDLEILPLLLEKNIPIYAHNGTWKDIKHTMPWLFPATKKKYNLEDLTLDYGQKLCIKDISLIPFQQNHGVIDSTGFRINNFAYSTDLNSLPEESWKILDGIDTWILECDSLTPTSHHNHLDQALEWIEKLKPQRTYLTHIHPYVDHASLEKQLPNNVHVAFDGLEIEI